MPSVAAVCRPPERLRKRLGAARPRRLGRGVPFSWNNLSCLGVPQRDEPWGRTGSRFCRGAPLKLRPLAFEGVALATLISCAGALAARGQGIALASISDTAGWLVASAPAALALGLTLQALHRYAEGDDPRRFFGALRHPTWWAGWVRAWLACWTTSFAYFWLKVSVPRLNAEPLDAALWQLDRTLHLGTSPSRLAVAWLGAPSVAGVLDAWYALWLPSVVWCLAFFAAASEPRVRNGVVLSCVLLWALGAWLYVALPALGPIFVFPEVFASVAGGLPRAAAAQAALLENYQRVLAGAGPEAIRHTLGIAALPSLHVGFHVLFTLWARAEAPLLFLPFAAGTLLTFLGSLVTGWHYAVDGYLGAALAALCYGLARRIESAPGALTSRQAAPAESPRR